MVSVHTSPLARCTILSTTYVTHAFFAALLGREAALYPVREAGARGIWFGMFAQRAVLVG
jgi:hypothetical protein